MKKNKKTALMAAVLTGAAMLTGCDVGHDDLTTVYGPPVTEAVTTTKPVTVPALYGPPETETFTTDAVTTTYDPSKDEIQDVYGPPAAESTDIEEGTEPYSPEKDGIQLVYGPPESFTE